MLPYNQSNLVRTDELSMELVYPYYSSENSQKMKLIYTKSQRKAKNNENYENHEITKYAKYYSLSDYHATSKLSYISHLTISPELYIISTS